MNEARTKELLATELEKMEINNLVQEIVLKILNKTQVPGEIAGQVDNQKKFIESTMNLNKLVIADLKETYFKGEDK